MVSVRGEAVLEVEPEIATLRVTTVARDRDREKAVAGLERRAAELAALVEGYGLAVETQETSAVRIAPQFKDGRPTEKIVGYDAVMVTTLGVVGFDRLGDLVSELGTSELTSVGGPWWSLRVDSDRYREARVAAAHDAVRRAREYAEALGASLSGLVELADTGLMTERAVDPFGPGPPPVAPAAMAAPGGAAPGSGMRAQPAIDFSPAIQIVRARVEARFTMTPPTLA